VEGLAVKVIKGVVKVIGIVATVLAFIPGPHQPIAATVAKVAAITSAALEIVAPYKARPPARNGSLSDYRLDPQIGIPYMMGDVYFAGVGVKRETWGKDNKHQGFTSVYSLGPIQQVTQFYVDRNPVNFDGTTGNAIGAYNDRMHFRSQVGLCPSPHMVMPGLDGNLYPGWDANSKLSGLAASHWKLGWDKEGKLFTSGPPVPGIRGLGVKVYDPRLDSTYPGGSGACRALDESTYVYSNRPALHALTYALGRYQNGKRRFGIGFPVSSIDVASFVAAANVEDANGWEISGVIFSTDGKWNALKNIMEAGCAEPITMGGKLVCVQSAPRVSVATITSAEVVGRCSVVGTQSQRDRINTVVPRLRSPNHGWEMISLDEVSVSSYVTADGRKRSRELEWHTVTKQNQAAQLSYYYMMNAREFGPIELTVKIRWIGLKIGDCVTLNIPELNLNSQKAIVQTRSFDVASGAVTLTLRSETDAKHASALAANGTAPPIAGLTFNADVAPAAPVAGSWTLTSGGLISSGGSTVPSLRFAGATDNEAVDAIEFSYRKVGTTTWTVATLVPSTTTRYDASAVEPGAIYEGRVRYFGGPKPSDYLALNPITVIADTVVGQGDLATLDAIAWGSSQLTNLPANLAALVGNEAIKNQDIIDLVMDDDKVTRAEKNGPIKQAVADLEARYQYMSVRAAAAGISVVAMDAARADFYTVMRNIVKYQEDTDTNIYTNPYFADDNLSSFTPQAGIGVSVGPIWTTLTDDNTGAFEYLERFGPVVTGVGSNRSFGIYVQKNAAHNQLVLFRFQSYGSTQKYGDLILNPATGFAMDNGGALGGMINATVFDLGDEYFVCGVIQTHLAGTQQCGLTIYPAVSLAAPNPVNYNSNVTGSVNVRGVRSAVGTRVNLGRPAIQGFTSLFAQQIAAVGKAISERDGTTGLVINPPPSVTIYATNAGAAKAGELPRDVSLSASVGLASVTTLGVWSVLAQTNCSATINASTGNLNITAVASADASVKVQFVYNSIIRTAEVAIKRQDDPPTVAGTGGGSGGTGTSASTTTLGSTINSSYNLTTDVSGTILVKSGASGQVTLTAPLTFRRAIPKVEGETKAWAKWQWRAIGGSFADVGAEMGSTNAYTTAPDPETGTLMNVQGNANWNQTKTGLAANTDYEFRLVWRHQDINGTSRTLNYVSGTMQGVGS
jgi:hypothetical protein